ncbi:hypothetical protein [Longirhabdus pacifica]|uniref:hypothetical protein n=1 Tax=Longirhabdus pacifica TaxID=2305227 RepID=UPI00100914C0|nr:hypothetical protein [Longirhabdus pacifica]
MNQHHHHLKHLDAHQAAKSKTSAFNNPGGNGYPGLPPFGGGSQFGDQFPFSGNPGGGGSSQGGGSPPAKSGSGSGSNFSFNDVKNIMSRMGGVEGMMGTFNKVGSFMQSMQKMSPMLRLLLGSFLGKTSATSQNTRRKRKRKRRRNTTSNRNRTYAKKNQNRSGNRNGNRNRSNYNNRRTKKRGKNRR